jgi:hypothetical protein
MKAFLFLPICMSMLCSVAAITVASAQELDKEVVLEEGLRGFVVTSDGAEAATADTLYRVDLSSGVATLVGPLGPVGGAFEDVEGLAIDRNGAMYGVDDDTKTLLSLNLSNGRATAVAGMQGNTRIAAGVNNPQDLSIAFGCNNELYGAAARAKSLYQVNVATGAFEQIGSVGGLNAVITDMSFSQGQLYGLGEDTLFRIDTRLGTATPVGLYGNGVKFLDGGGLAADANGQLWAVAERRDVQGRVQASQIYRISAESGMAILVGQTAAQGVESLAIGPPSCSEGVGVVRLAAPTVNVFGAALLLLGLIILGRRSL